MVDTSLFEAGIVHTYWQSAMALATGIAPGPMGSAHPLNAPYQAFETKDGWITIGAANQKNWLRLLDALEAPELADDKRFRVNADRMANLDALTAILSKTFRTRSQAVWLTRLETAGVPAGPVLDVNQMHADPQTRAREMIVGTEHSHLGTVETIGCPLKFSETPSGVHRSAPVYGEHTREVLAEYGYRDTEIIAILAAGAAVANK
jgi:crotonobetainyl-CoA:carnitine CoA-transferase CaiB-like acyl-CoA transferase